MSAPGLQRAHGGVGHGAERRDRGIRQVVGDRDALEPEPPPQEVRGHPPGERRRCYEVIDRVEAVAHHYARGARGIEGRAEGDEVAVEQLLQREPHVGRPVSVGCEAMPSPGKCFTAANTRARR